MQSLLRRELLPDEALSLNTWEAAYSPLSGREPECNIDSWATAPGLVSILVIGPRWREFRSFAREIHDD